VRNVRAGARQEFNSQWRESTLFNHVPQSGWQINGANWLINRRPIGLQLVIRLLRASTKQPGRNRPHMTCKFINNQQPRIDNGLTGTVNFNLLTN